MAKVTNSKAPKNDPPSRLTHQAGITMPDALIRFLVVYNAFVGKMTEEFRLILEAEDSVAKDVLELILMLESKFGYYPVSVLLGIEERESDVPKSYFARVDSIRAKTPVGKTITSLSKHLFEGANLPENLEGLKRILISEITEEELLEQFLKNQSKQPLMVAFTVLAKEALENALKLKFSGLKGEDRLKMFLENNPEWVIFKRVAPFVSEAMDDPLVRKILNFDRAGKDKLELLPPCLNAWKDVDSSFLEMVIVGSLQLLSSNRELMELWLKEEEARQLMLAEFEASDEGIALLKYCERFEKGAWHYLTNTELREARNWRSPTELVVPNGKSSGKSLRINNPEIDAFLKAKKTWTDLNRGKRPPTWTPVTFDQNPHFPFFDGKFVGDRVSENGKTQFQALYATNVARRLCTALNLPEISDEILSGLNEGRLPSVLGKKKLVPIVLQPEARLRGAEFLMDGKTPTFVRRDPVSTRVVSEVFKGIRFSRNKKSGYWRAWMTTEPTFQYEAQFQDAMSAYWKGENSCLPAGTILSSFVVSITPTHHPDGEIGHMTFWGIGDHGSPVFLGATKVSPYQVFKDADAKRMVWDPALHAGTGGFRKGQARGASASMEVNGLLNIKRIITSSRKAMGYPESILPVGENSYWWKKLRESVDTLRKQTAANVMAIQAVIEGVGASRKAGELKFKRPNGVVEFRSLYPEGGYVLLVPAPMGASHQRHKEHPDNRVLQIVGVAQIYELILARAFPSGVSTMRVSKVGLFTRCAKPPAKWGVESNNASWCDGKFPDHGDPELVCPKCKATYSRGFVGSSNLLQEFLTPAPKNGNGKKKKTK